MLTSLASDNILSGISISNFLIATNIIVIHSTNSVIPKDRSRLQDLVYFCRAVSWPSQARELLHYLNDTTEELAERIPFSSRLRVITDVGLCCTAEDLSIVEKLNDKSCKFCHDRILQETCDYIKANINSVKIFSKQLQ
ncbi:MAG: hypothetical protein MHMPM18_004050 [Marteilia pararefringens]